MSWQHCDHNTDKIFVVYIDESTFRLPFVCTFLNQDRQDGNNMKWEKVLSFVWFFFRSCKSSFDLVDFDVDLPSLIPVSYWFSVCFALWAFISLFLFMYLVLFVLWISSTKYKGIKMNEKKNVVFLNKFPYESHHH